MNEEKRPLSPHLQVYRLPLTGIISITHRMTGVFLSLGVMLTVFMLVSISSGSLAYTELQNLLNNFLLQLLLWSFIYALFFHLCHGIRHLIWDAGFGFDKDTMDRYAEIELVASVLLTLSVYLLF